MTKKIAIIGCGKIPKGRLDVLKSRAIKEFGDNVEFNLITMNQENKTPHSFCETPEEKCTMNYCDENGCQNRKRHLVEENKRPTAAEYIETIYGSRNFARSIVNDDASSIMSLMEDFSDYCSKPLQARIAELEKKNEHLIGWKESAMKTLSDLNLQECGKLLNIGLGQSLAINLVPKIKELKAENERLKTGIANAIEAKVGLHKDYIRLNTDSNNKDLQIQKLKEALEYLMQGVNNLPPLKAIEGLLVPHYNKAKEALKGENK